MSRTEKLIAVVALVLIVINSAVFIKQTNNDQETIELKQNIYKIRESQDKLEQRIERVEKVVLVKTKQIAMSKTELDCLAKNIYHEAGVEDRAGKIAVAQVTINRLKEGRWGNTVCKVVYAKAQFSWTLNKKKRTAQPKGPLWDQSLAVAREFQSGTRIKGLEDSQYYHADYIRNPSWTKAKQVAKYIGQHIFYKG